MNAPVNIPLVRHFIDIHEVDQKHLRSMLQHAQSRKLARKGYTRGRPDADLPLKGQTLAMIFDKPSTRTRVSFDMAMRQLGGDTIMLTGAEMQLGRGETIADTARVLSRYVDAIVIRTGKHETVKELAEHATVPVINGLTYKSHPCQLMADIMTFEERLGAIDGRVVSWLGDGNNVAHSWIHAATQLGFVLRLACPEELRPDEDVMAWARGHHGDVTVMEDPSEAVVDADCVVTDTWVSMGDSDAVRRHNLLRPYQVNGALMQAAADHAIFMHCLPAHRGEEVTSEVIDSTKSVVFDEAENRVHAQKAILQWCLGTAS